VDGRREEAVLRETETPRTYIDYLKYLVTFAPQVQATFNASCRQICQLSNSVYDREESVRAPGEFEAALAQIEQNKRDIDALRAQAVDPRNLRSIKRRR
jgi:hypothetical protein